MVFLFASLSPLYKLFIWYGLLHTYTWAVSLKFIDVLENPTLCPTAFEFILLKHNLKFDSAPFSLGFELTQVICNI